MNTPIIVTIIVCITILLSSTVYSICDVVKEKNYLESLKEVNKNGN